MHLLTLLSAVLAIAIPATAVLNGENVTANAYDYTVAIMQPGLAASEGGRGSTDFICNGILVSEFSVLTAAECVQGADASMIDVRVGFPGTFQNVTVNNITANPTFNYTSLAGDVALLNLTEPVTNITPAPLASANFDGAYPSGCVHLVGWGGVRNDTQGMAPKLEAATVDVMNSSLCASQLSTCAFALDTSQRFCTTSTPSGAEGYGDAGGPIVDNEGIVVGLMTGNPECAQPNSLAIQIWLSSPQIQQFIQTNKFGSA